MSFLTNNGSKYILLYLTNRSDKNINWNTLSYLYFATVLRYPLKVEINIKTRTNKDKTSIHKSRWSIPGKLFQAGKQWNYIDLIWIDTESNKENYHQQGCMKWN